MSLKNGAAPAHAYTNAENVQKPQRFEARLVIPLRHRGEPAPVRHRRRLREAAHCRDDATLRSSAAAAAAAVDRRSDDGRCREGALEAVEKASEALEEPLLPGLLLVVLPALPSVDVGCGS